MATHAGEIAALEGLAACAAGNGVRVELVDRAFAQAREPHVAAVAALWSPDTGRIEPEAYVRTLQVNARVRAGIDSPGRTSSLVIGVRVAMMVADA